MGLLKDLTSLVGDIVDAADHIINEEEYERERVAECYRKLINLHASGDTHKLMLYCDQLIRDEESDFILHQAHYYKGQAFLCLAMEIEFDDNDSDEDTKAKLEDVDKFIQWGHHYADKAISYLKTFSDDIEDYAECFLLKGNLIDYHQIIENDRSCYIKNAEEARTYYILAMNSSDAELVKDAAQKYDGTSNGLLSWYNRHITTESDDLAKQESFCNLHPFGERQFILITTDVAGCYDDKHIINWVFKPDQIPAELSFPVGHPQVNTLYIAHPAKVGHYLPFESAEDVLFHEKVDEFCRLAQCLGATEITFNSISGMTASQGMQSSRDASWNSDFKCQDIQGGYSGQSKADIYEEKRTAKGHSYSLNPKVKPYCPDDMAWLNTDDSWKSLVKQRLEGDILTYAKKISSSETIQMSSQLSNSVKSSFGNLMLNINSDYNSTADSTFSRAVHTEWEIIVQFKSIYDFENPMSLPESGTSIAAKLNDQELSYKEEILFMLEDGEIGSSERKFLERKRLKLGISEERAKEIEEMCKPQLSKEEIEYLETYREIAEDGEITERKRKMLIREAESLGIGVDRALELEKL